MTFGRRGARNSLLSLRFMRRNCDVTCAIQMDTSLKSDKRRRPRVPWLCMCNCWTAAEWNVGFEDKADIVQVTLDDGTDWFARRRACLLLWSLMGVKRIGGYHVVHRT